MQPILSIFEDFLKGKDSYSSFRRIANLLFSISITSFVFEIIYFKYDLIDISDYKGIYNFFIKGHFITPFILFLGIHYLTYFISYGFFSLTTVKKTTDWVTKIVEYKIKRKDLYSVTRGIKKSPLAKLPYRNRQSWIVYTYLALKKSITAEQWDRGKLKIKKQSQIIEQYFILFFRAAIALSIYFAGVPHFGFITFSISMLFLISAMVFSWYTYTALTVLPVLVNKINKEIQTHLAKDSITEDSLSS